MIHIELTSSPIREADILSRLKNPAHGGRAFFFGAVRDFNDGQTVVGIEYEAFHPLARTTLLAIVGECQSQWGDLEIVVIHATGHLKVGEVSVGIGVSARHRREAFLACQYLIDELKIRAPIWKKEFYETGESDWVQGHALCQESYRVSARGRTEPSHGHEQSALKDNRSVPYRSHDEHPKTPPHS